MVDSRTAISNQNPVATSGLHQDDEGTVFGPCSSEESHFSPDTQTTCGPVDTFESPKDGIVEINISPNVVKYCLANPISVTENSENDVNQKGLDKDWSTTSSQLKTAIQNNDPAATGSLGNLVDIAYRRRNLPALTEAVKIAKRNYEVATDELAKKNSYSMSCNIKSGSINGDSLTRDAKNAVSEAYAKLQTALTRKQQALNAVVEDIFGVLFSAGNTPEEAKDPYTAFTSDTYAVIANSFIALGESNTADRFYLAAIDQASDVAQQIHYTLMRMDLLDDEALKTHKSDLENIFNTRIPALQAMARAIAAENEYTKIEFEKNKKDIGGFLETFRAAVESGALESLDEAEKKLILENPKAYYYLVSSLYGKDVAEAFKNQYNIKDDTIKFSQEAWKNAGYSWNSGNIEPAIGPGNIDMLALANIQAWKLLHRLTKNEGRHKRWNHEKKFDSILKSRIGETDGKLPAREAMLFASCFGEMLLNATVKNGDLEKLMIESGDPDKRLNILKNRFAAVVNVLSPYAKKETGNPFFEMKASLAMRLEFDTLMAIHRYPAALDHAIPRLMEEYNNTNTFRKRFESLSKLYPDHFEDNCVISGVDFSSTEQALDVISREEALFMSNHSVGDILWGVGAGVGGGAVGCAVGGIIGFAVGNGPGAAVGCKAGGFIGGSLAAGGMEMYNLHQHVAEHKDEIEHAMRAGVSSVLREEADSYRRYAMIGVGLNFVFGGFYGKAGSGLVRIGAKTLGFGIGASAVDVAATEGVRITESAAETVKRSLLRKAIELPNGTKVMIVGGSLVGLDYFGIDDINFETKTGDLLPTVHVDWGVDYHVDTAAGIAGAVLLAVGTGKRLIESPEFRRRFARLMVGSRRNPGINPEIYNSAGFFRTKLFIDSSLLVEEGGELVFGSLKQKLAFPFNALIGNMERVSAPLLISDFTVQQFLTDESYLEENGIDKTPRLSVVGGLSMALLFGNRAAIRVFGIKPGGQRVYFLIDRGLDMYTMLSSGGVDFWEADWFRIGAKYISGWGVGQVRGNMLRYWLARKDGMRYVKALALEANGFASVKMSVQNLSRTQLELYKKLLKFTDGTRCTVRIDRAGRIISGRNVIHELSQHEQSLIARLVLKDSTVGAQFASIFKNGQSHLDFIVNPTFNKRGLAAFAILHDTVIGTSYDYIRGEYIIFGDGMGYATWTALRSISVLPLRTALKVNFGWHSGAAIASDLIPRFTIDPYWTNWTRIYAKSGLWWPHIDETLVGDKEAFSNFFSGTSAFSANGVDTWNRNHYPLNLATRPEKGEPDVDTFGDGYKVLTQKLMDGKLSPDKMETFDMLLSDLISDARVQISASVKTDNAQKIIEHAEVLSAVAYVCHQKNPSAFKETFEKHERWISNILGPVKPLTPSDVKTLATKFGEYTFFGSTAESLKTIPGIGNFFSGIEGRSQGYKVTPQYLKPQDHQ